MPRILNLSAHANISAPALFPSRRTNESTRYMPLLHSQYIYMHIFALTLIYQQNLSLCLSQLELQKWRYQVTLKMPCFGPYVIRLPPLCILQSEASSAAITIIRSNHGFSDYYHASRTYLVAVLVRIGESFSSH